jgi:hypothetical protein
MLTQAGLLSVIFMTNSAILKAETWQVINDSVMGGLSYGTVATDHQFTNFQGHISTEHNGGFSSAYQEIPKLSDKTRSVQIKIKGGGLRYQLRARSQINGYEIAYKVEFDTQANKVETFIFNFNEFQATFRGRNIDNAPQLQANTISHIGFLINHQQPTDFSLSIHSIHFIK